MASTTPLQTTGMNIQVSGKHMAVGDALRTRVTEALTGGIGKYFERGGSAEVVVSKEAQGAIGAEIRVTLATGQKLNASGSATDAHAAVDIALGRVEGRIRRYKRRLTSHHPHNGAAAERAAYTVLRAPDDEDELGSDEWGYDGSAGEGAPAGAIIAETESEVRSLTVSMAVMELDLTEAPVLVFRNAAHGGVSVVYRRADGNIGWIDPERAPARLRKAVAPAGAA